MKTRILSLSALLLTTSLSFSLPAHAEETKDPYADNLTGNWGGARNKLSDKGIDVTVEYKADFWNVSSGGTKHGGNYLDNMDLKFNLDNEKLLGIKGNKALIYFLNNDGNKPNESRIGSVQGIDNIEVGTNTFKLYEAWDEQTFLDNKLAVLVGLHDLNSEFMAPDMSANFIKPTFQVSQTLAQTGQNGPSIFPNTSMAARVKAMPTDTSYVSFAVFDGVPGNPNRPHGTHVDFNKGDGLLLIAEAGVTPKPAEGVDGNPNKFAVGAWTYTKGQADLEEVDASGNPAKNRSVGAYLLTSYQFYNDKANGRDMGVFFRGGVADADVEQIDWDYELGVVAHGWVPGRGDAEIGLGFSQANNGGKYMRSVGSASHRDEYGYELYYRDKLMNGVTIQPDLQYIMNPGTSLTEKDALAFGIRLDINF